MLPQYISVLILSHRLLVRPQPPQTTIPKWNRTRTRMVQPLSPLSKWDVSLMEAAATLVLLRPRIMERRGQVACSPGSPNTPLEVLMIGLLILQWPMTPGMACGSSHRLRFWTQLAFTAIALGAAVQQIDVHGAIPA